METPSEPGVEVSSSSDVAADTEVPIPGEPDTFGGTEKLVHLSPSLDFEGRVWYNRKVVDTPSIAAFGHWHAGGDFFLAFNKPVDRLLYVTDKNSQPLDPSDNFT